MYLTTKCRNVVRGLLQAYGTEAIKRHLWNSEFAGGRWNGLDSSPGDCVYPFVEKYANGGAILDLGCGSGSTGNELAITSYSTFTGVDISDVAIERARKRGIKEKRQAKNHYLQADICSYIPEQRFDVILFRDSIYYIPRNDIHALLERYSNYLTTNGVFVIRMFSSTGKYQGIVEIVENSFNIIERYACEGTTTTVVVARPRSAVASPAELQVQAV